MTDIYNNIIKNKYDLSNKCYLTDHDSDSSIDNNFIYYNVNDTLLFPYIHFINVNNIYNFKNNVNITNYINLNVEIKMLPFNFDSYNLYKNNKKKVIDIYENIDNVNNKYKNEIKKYIVSDYITIDFLSYTEIIVKHDLCKNINDSNYNHFNINDNNGAFIYSIFYVLKKDHDFVQCIYDNSFESSINISGKSLYKNNKDKYLFIENKIDSISKYVNKYSKITFNIITSISNDKNGDMFDIFFYNLYMTLLLCKNGTNCIFDINGTINENIINIIYLLTFCFNEVILSDPVISEPLKDNIICVCKKFKYDNNKKMVLDYLRKWYKLYRTSNLLLFNGDFMDDNFNNKINDFLDTRYKRLVINTNSLYYKFNNRKYIKRTSLKDLKYDLIKNKINYIDTIFNVGQLKGINSNGIFYNMSRSDYSSEKYKKIYYPDDHKVLNEYYMYYLIGYNTHFNYIHKEDEITNPKIVTTDDYIQVSREIEEILRKKIYNIVVNKYYSIINPYNRMSLIKCFFKSVSYIYKMINNPEKKINCVIYSIYHTIITKSLLEELSELAHPMALFKKKYGINTTSNNISIYDINDFSIKKDQDITYVCFYDNISYKYGEKLICNILLEKIMEMIYRLNINGSIVISITYGQRKLFDMINIISKYFHRTRICNYKYVFGTIMDIIFYKKNDKLDKKEYEFINDMIKNNNTGYYYNNAMYTPYITYFERISKLREERMMFIMTVFKAFINDDNKYDIILDKIKKININYEQNELNLLHMG